MKLGETSAETQNDAKIYDIQQVTLAECHHSFKNAFCGRLKCLRSVTGLHSSFSIPVESTKTECGENQQICGLNVEKNRRLQHFKRTRHTI